MLKAMDGVNAYQTENTSLVQQMLVDPDSVDAHDVTLAMSQGQYVVEYRPYGPGPRRPGLEGFDKYKVTGDRNQETGDGMIDGGRS